MKKGILFILCVFSLMGLVLGAGVSMPYWIGYPLEIKQGETQVITFTLQNNAGEPDMWMRAVMEDNQGIAFLPNQTDYFVPSYTTNTSVPITIKVPRNKEPGTYQVRLTFRTIVNDSSGGIIITTGYRADFDVLVLENPNKTSCFEFRNKIKCFKWKKRIRSSRLRWFMR